MISNIVIISAFSNGIKTVYIPYDNENDLDDVPKIVKEKLEIILVKDYEDIYNNIFKIKDKDKKNEKK